MIYVCYSSPCILFPIDCRRFTPPIEAPSVPIRSHRSPLPFAPKIPLRNAVRPPNLLAGVRAVRRRVCTIPADMLSPRRQIPTSSISLALAHPPDSSLEFLCSSIVEHKLDPTVARAAASPSACPRRSRRQSMPPTSPSAPPRHAAPISPLLRAQPPPERRARPSPEPPRLRSLLRTVPGRASCRQPRHRAPLAEPHLVHASPSLGSHGIVVFFNDRSHRRRPSRLR